MERPLFILLCTLLFFHPSQFAAWLKFPRETRCSKPLEWFTTFGWIMIIASAFKSNWTRGLRQLDAKHSPSFCGRRWVAKDVTMCLNCMASSAAHLFSAKLYRYSKLHLRTFYHLLSQKSAVYAWPVERNCVHGKLLSLATLFLGYYALRT